MSFFYNSIVDGIVINEEIYSLVNNSVQLTVKELLSKDLLTKDSLKNLKYSFKHNKLLQKMTNEEKLVIANRLLADKNLSWDELSNINSLDDAETEEDIKELVQERLEEDGFDEEEVEFEDDEEDDENFDEEPDEDDLEDFEDEEFSDDEDDL